MGSDISKDGCFHYPTMDRRNLSTLRNYLCNYKPPVGCGDCINILLFGMVGAGKSSIINTFLSALDPQGTIITCVPTGTDPWSLTKQLRSFNPDVDFANYPVIPENVIHGVAFVFDISTMDSISDDKMEEFQELQTIVVQKYVHRVVIGTKFELLGIPEKDNAWIYEYKPLQWKFELLAERTGIEKRSMFVVSNQWRGDQIEMIKCILALYVLDNMVRNIDRFLRAV
ncbi:interferon-induced protein 44-like isoform X2 [Hemitrygon akajei]|uniref:interferon-induced protein 44-like isoform X2 n=1 Tax=Hemitrygon akajei TaxID=2704970 RepID=UPI003BF9651F